MRRFIVVTVLSLAIVACKRDREVASQNPITWTVASMSGLLQPASTDTVHFTAAIDSGWYIYSITQKPGGPTPMSVTIAPSPPYALVGDVVGPKPVVIFDKEFGINSERYTGNPAFAALVSIPSGARSRPPSLDLKVRYQACNATLCLPAHTTTLTTPIRVAEP
ncbi:MAG: protein-disulfide reductase DsbD domain-containing protein [Gemmatimonadaceae bacterium]